MKLQGLSRWFALLTLLLVGQLDKSISAVQTLAPILSMLVTIIVLIALPILVFHVLVKEVLSKI